MMLPDLFLLSLYPKHTKEFSRMLNDECNHNRPNTESVMRLKIPSIKSDIKEICKKVKQGHFSH